MSNIKKPLSSAQISAMKPGDSDLADTGENRGLRVNCAKGVSRPPVQSTFLVKFRLIF